MCSSVLWNPFAETPASSSAQEGSRTEGESAKQVSFPVSSIPILSSLLRRLADEVELHDESQCDNEELIDIIMQFWGKVPKAWKNRILNKQTNRAYKAITGYPADESDIDIAVKTTVWIWDDDPDSFISWRSSPQQGTAPLDFFISLVNTVGQSTDVNTIRWRVLLMVIAHFDSLYDAPANLPEQLLQSGLISASFHSQICGKWPQMVRGGGKYNSMSNDLGGYGAMVYIPDVGHTTYEVHLPSTGTTFSATIEELRKKKVPKKAERKWTVPDTEYQWKNPVNANKKRNAHEVIKTVVDHLLAKIEKIVSPVRQLHVRFYEPQPRQPGGKKVLASRKRKDGRRGGISKKPTKGGRKSRQPEPPVPVDSRADDTETNDDASYPQSASLDILANVANNVSCWSLAISDLIRVSSLTGPPPSRPLGPPALSDISLAGSSNSLLDSSDSSVIVVSTSKAPGAVVLRLVTGVGKASPTPCASGVCGFLPLRVGT